MAFPRFPRRSYAWLAVGAAAAVLLGNRGFRRLIAGTLELRRLRQEYAALQTEEKQLALQLDRAHKSDFAIESAARRELGYVRKGELEYRFPPPKK